MEPVNHRQLSPAEERDRKGCIGCLVIIAIPIVLLGTLYLAANRRIDSSSAVEIPHQPAEKIEASSEPARLDRHGITIGTSSDDVLAKRGKPREAIRRANDESGIVVDWVYDDITYVFGLRKKDGVTAYRIIEIK